MGFNVGKFFQRYGVKIPTYKGYHLLGMAKVVKNSGKKVFPLKCLALFGEFLYPRGSNRIFGETHLSGVHILRGEVYYSPKDLFVSTGVSI